MKKITLYIGADNADKMVDKEKVIEVLSDVEDGWPSFTVAVIECVENRIIDGKLRWWLHCRMRDGSYHLFNDVSDSTYNQLCKEEAEYELLRLGAEVEKES